MHDSSLSGPTYHLQERLIPKSPATWSWSFVAHSHLHRLWQTLPAVVAAGAQVTDTDQRVHGSLRPKGNNVVLYMPKPINECWGEESWDGNSGTRGASEIFTVDFREETLSNFVQSTLMKMFK